MKKSILFTGILFVMHTSCNQQPSVTVGYAGEDISRNATILRDQNNNQIVLDLKTEGKWELYAGPSVEKINLDKPVAQGTSSGRYQPDIDTTVRNYFELVTPSGKAILAERRLPLQGSYNFRDLGGIRTRDGRYTQWDKVFRSDDMMHLTEKDLDYLSKIPIKTVVDFRSETEIKQSPDQKIPSVSNSYIYAITPGNITSLPFEDIARLTTQESDSLMKSVNKQLVTDSSAIEQYRKFFALLQEEENIPLVFHCTAGKDRTGYGAYLFLSSLGVDEQTALQDYLASNNYLAAKYGSYMEKYPDLKPLFEVRPEYLKTAIDQIRKEHGNVENYLTNVLNVDIEKMRELYLY